jgi:hypothetical protein
MKAKGSDIYDFYLNGWPENHSHGSYDLEIAYWPHQDSLVGARSLLENDVEYDLSLFGKVYDDINNTSITFEDAYLAWKGIEKPVEFEEWLLNNDQFCWRVYTSDDKVPLNRKDLKTVWDAAITSVGVINES